MAKNISSRKPSVKNIRSHALNATKKKQKLNLITVKDINGRKFRISAKELRTLKKDTI